MKGCAEACVDGLEQSFGPSTVSYRCCTNDLCNFSIRNFNFGIQSKFLAVGLLLLAMGLWSKN